MKAIERFKNNFINNDYFISIYKNHIYIINYINIIDFKSNKIIIRFNEFKLLIKGINFKIVRKNNIELEIIGNFNSMEIVNE